MIAMRILSFLVATLFVVSPLAAQTPAPPPAKSYQAQDAAPSPAATAPSGPLAPLAWLEGCWRGEVAKREFREHWLPLRGDTMLGASHTVMNNKTLDYEYLRLEARGTDVYYVALPSGKPETAFKLTDVATQTDATTFTFTNPRDEFPQHIRYRRGTEGWLYAQVDGTINGAERKVIYPMRHVDCENGEFIRQ
jgi:hypothetical protein